jgi:hypothetical protein
MEVPEKDAVVGAIEEHPSTPVLIFIALIIGRECRVIHRQSGICGSGVTV